MTHLTEPQTPMGEVHWSQFSKRDQADITKLLKETPVERRCECSPGTSPKKRCGKEWVRCRAGEPWLTQAWRLTAARKEQAR